MNEKIQILNKEEIEQINNELSGSVDISGFRENLTENIQEEYLTLNNPDIIQVNNYQTQINQESDVKQEQINLTSPLARSKRIAKQENEHDSNNKGKKSFLNSLPKSPLNKIGLNKEQFTTFNADTSSNLINSQQKLFKQSDSNYQIEMKEIQGDKIEVVGKIVGQQIKKTFNFIYDKIQEGVITTLNQAIENQKEHERMNNRRAHSSNPSIDQQRFIFNNQHQSKIFEQQQQHNNQTINYPTALSPSLKSLNNINIKTARESRSVFRQQLPINANDFQDKIQSDKIIQGRPPQHTTRDRIENKLTIKSQILNDKNLLNEVANLRQEKIFLAQTIQNQEIQFQEQLQITLEKQQYKNEKNERKQKYFKEFIEELQKQIKIESVQLDESLQQENLKYFQYEVLKHIHSQNEEIQKLKEQNLKKEGALEMKSEELVQKTQELYDLQEQQKQKEIQIQIDQSDFQNEREAQYLKMQLQNEKIQEMTKIVEEKKETLQNQNELFQQQQQQIQNLNNLINQQNDELNFKEKSLQEKLQKIQNQYNEQKELKDNIEIEFKQKENKYQKEIEVLLKRVEELEQLKDLNQNQVKQYNEIHLQKDKKSFKLECDLEQMQKQIDKLQKEIQVVKIQKEELLNQNQDNLQRLKITEFQLIQAKSSWAESEHEREQLFNRVQELEERLDPGSFSQRSYQINPDNHSQQSKSNI